MKHITKELLGNFWSRWPFIVGGLIISLSLSGAVLADTIYDVNRSTGGGSVEGTIITNGAIGALIQSDIVSWKLILKDGTSPPITITEDDSVLLLEGSMPIRLLNNSYIFA